MARALEGWYRRNARDLPWRRTRDPWAILLSEVLLQQTRVGTAARAYPRLLRRFPTPASMARASGRDVLAAWAGLGYYHRARSLRAAAKAIAARHGGRVPQDPSALAALPGVGPYTAAAVRAFAFHEPTVPLDANVARVLARLAGERGSVDTGAARRRLVEEGTRIVAAGRPRNVAQALMELGALVCRAARPDCAACPLSRSCAARRLGAVERIPRRRPRKAPRRERWAFARVTAPDGSILLVRRDGPGLLQGFWMLPGIRLVAGARPGEALVSHLAALGVEARVAYRGERGAWAFTHVRWAFRVHEARVVAKGRPLNGTRWVRPSRVAALPVATVHRGFLGVQGPVHGAGGRGARTRPTLACGTAARRAPLPRRAS